MRIHAECTRIYPKTWPWKVEQIVTDIVAHVDTVIVWGMKQVYTRTTLKSKYV